MTADENIAILKDEKGKLKNLENRIMKTKNLESTIEKIKGSESENLAKSKNVEQKIEIETEELGEKPEKQVKPKTDNTKYMIEKIRNLYKEKDSLLIEIGELKKIVNEKAAALENEIVALREESKMLRNLVDELQIIIS